MILPQKGKLYRMRFIDSHEICQVLSVKSTKKVSHYEVKYHFKGRLHIAQLVVDQDPWNGWSMIWEEV